MKRAFLNFERKQLFIKKYLNNYFAFNDKETKLEM